MKLSRFSKANKPDAKKKFAWSLFFCAIERFNENLYNNLIQSRKNIGPNFYPSLSTGRSESYTAIVDNLDVCKYIVDGKNQNITQQFVIDENGEKLVDTKYYNFKTNGNGVKVLAFVDWLGMVVQLTNHVQASVHDSTLYNITFDSSLIPPKYVCMGDGGFRGSPRIICNYPKNLSNISAKGKTFVTDRRVLVSVQHGNEIIEGIGGFYGVIKEYTSCTKMTGFFEGNFGSKENMKYVKTNGSGYIRKTHQDTMEEYWMESFISDKEVEVFGSKKITIKCNCKGYSADTKYLRAYNIALSSIRIIIENTFGRNNLLWNSSSKQYNWNLRYYDMVTRCTFAATNYHMFIYPLRSFPFALFAFTTNNTLGLNLTQISKLKIPVQCLQIIGFESDEKLVEREQSIGNYYNMSLRKQGPLDENTKVKVPTGLPSIENYEFKESNSSSIEEEIKMCDEKMQTAIEEIENQTFIEINYKYLYDHYKNISCENTQIKENNEKECNCDGLSHNENEFNQSISMIELAKNYYQCNEMNNYSNTYNNDMNFDSKKDTQNDSFDLLNIHNYQYTTFS